jgi:hypothetical protein
MEMQQYKYDVAFSFLAQDEELAIQINDLLQDSVQIFLYSKKQGEIAGTDGEKSFNKVFGEQSRLVVVLYIEVDGAKHLGQELKKPLSVIVPMNKATIS